MGNLILDSLEIRGFRCFRHLQIERLGRVNLIVGKNNVGKSALLEALLLYAGRNAWPLVWELLATRDEGPWPPHDILGMLQSLKYLFYGRKDIRLGVSPIQIGPTNLPRGSLSLEVTWFENKGNQLVLSSYSEDQFIRGNLTPSISLNIGKGALYFHLSPSPGLAKIGFGEINHVFIPTQGLNDQNFEELWSNIALRFEEEVLDALRLAAPGIEGLRFVKAVSTREEERLAIVKVADIEDPIPLRSLGNGMLRILGIALAIVNAKDGMLFIDEFENGLYFSMQSKIWHLIFQLAQRLNVQVFATTHSWDCIEGFQKVAQENEQVEGLLISLENRKAGIKAVLFNEEELGIVARERIEVR